MTTVTLILLALIAAILGWLLRRERLLRRDEAEAFRLSEERLGRTHAASLRERTTQLETLVEEMPEALVAVNAAGEIQRVNRAAAQLFGLSGQVAGRPVLELMRLPELVAVLDRLRTEQEVRDFNVQLQFPTPRFLRLNAANLPGAAGSLLVFHDLTTLKRLESARQDFVANVSHELRTPLSLIKSAVETLIDDKKGDPQTREKFLVIIDRHAARLGLLIEDLLLLSALDSGRIELRIDQVDLSAIVQEVVADLSEAAAARKVSVDRSIPAGLMLRADQLRLRQILSNLIDNAIKHGREGGHVLVKAEVLAGGIAEVSVRDDGEGIPEAVRDRVFERFFRLDKARSRQQGGTGLGLAIVKNLALAHGGEVWVESSTGSGSTFHLKLPTE